MTRGQLTAADGASKAARRGGRPSASRASAIDAIIRKAALELFLEEGFDAVTMEMIAKRARVSKPTLYTRHPGKVELLRVVVQDEVMRWIAQARDQDQELPGDLAGRLQSHARKIVASQDWSDFRRLNRLITGVAATHPEILRSPYEVALRPVITLLANDLRDAATLAGLGTADWDFLAEMFFHAIFGWYNSASMLGRVTDDEASGFIDKMVELVLTAARTAAGKSPRQAG